MADIYSVTVRKQIHQTYLVEAGSLSEAKQMARDQDARLDSIGFDEIYPQPRPVVVEAKLDIPSI